ncbi:two-component system, NtrC family, C4-dicarboxylate transport sensor histidine kinase DctB [Pseudosulfitobacter pseudonitzschiae]|nr:ATP-binding protein [Pseudosulfitobacter pseudonitzschiae]QKS10186.1 sensor histidine kinase [Pseudosulfitobacter pseudonitzschiae]SHE82058.1 two-component system, NtrC family, C4-dicarboxylate transport sensor histidine kinase DctB [Pseudosulfitobacter pseudonitzschiae]
MIRTSHIRTFSLMLCLALLVAGFGGLIAYRIEILRLAKTLDQSLTLTRRSIETEIDRFRYLPEVAEEDVRISRAVTAPQNVGAVADANRYLETIAAVSGADQLYLLDQSGIAIAASNWNTPDTFVGIDYSFRPYFRDAIETGTGRFYGIGVTTGRPGYFLSSRVELESGDIAVLVVKIDLTPLQATWRLAAVDTAIADADGIIFLSGQPEWLYRPLFALDAGTRAQIAVTRSYEGVDFDSSEALLAAPPSSLTDGQPVDLAGRSLLLRRLPMGQDDWQVIQANPVADARLTALATAAILGLTTLAAALLVQTLLQRRRMIRMRLQQSRLLEQKVERRTRELAAEIETRIAAEKELTRAQDALIHSEKMAALGRMSAAIVHEISQPLAAMEATLAAAALGGTRDHRGTAKRIETARGHIRRMLRTIKHLKSFSRKDTGTLTPVDMDRVIENAIELVRHRADDIGAQLTYDCPGDAPPVMGGMVRLEQVLVNLLLNALDAVVASAAGQVRVTREVTPDAVIVTVKDNGVGLDTEAIAKIGEPFFSHKQDGEGLGLGVAISQSILQDFHGTLHYDAAPGQGTSATVTLPRAELRNRKSAA